MIIAYCFD